MIDFRLYLITDRKLFAGTADFFAAIDDAMQGGVRAIQLREKDLPVREMLQMSYEMRELTMRHGAKLFVNDRVDVAMVAGADGVHLGAAGLPPRAAREAAGEKLLIGVSAHSIEEAKTAEREGADFITMGPIYETPSKAGYGAPLGKDILAEVKKKVAVPVFAIGGIKKGRVGEVLKAGADGIALISGILGSGDPHKETTEFMRLLK